MKIFRALVVIAAVMAVLYAGAAPVVATDNSKWFVCKYVGTPGVDERLQTGNNPISVAGGSLPQPIVAGTFFNDSQGRSFILVEDTGQPEPDPSTCPPPDTGPSPTPTVTPTPTPSASPSPTPLQSPSPTPSPVASPTPTPTPASPTPTPEVSQFAVEPDVCRFEGDDSRIRFRVLAGLLLLSQVDIYIDGQLIDRNDIVFDLADREAFIVVAPGPHAWAITEEGADSVLAEGDVVCPTCFNLVSPTPPPGSVPPTPSGGTLPSTDTADGSTPALPLVLVALLAVVLATPFLVRRR